MTKSWASSVLFRAFHLADPKTHSFSRQDFIKKELPIVEKETESMGKTTNQTLSRIFQDLRDCGFLEFTKRGFYRLKNLKMNDDLVKKMKSGAKMSKGEKLIANLLQDLGIPFETQKKFKDLKHKGYLSFDFYFEHEGRKFVIEFQGEQHYRPVDFFGGEKTFKDQKTRDQIKKEYCAKNDINLIIIDVLDPQKALKIVAREILKDSPKLRSIRS